MNRKSCQHINVNSIVENILKSENVLHLLQTLEISAHNSINIINEISLSPVSKSILFEVPNDGCIGENKILLDIKACLFQFRIDI